MDGISIVYCLLTLSVFFKFAGRNDGNAETSGRYFWVKLLFLFHMDAYNIG
jgi:hypothetical protein